MFTSRRSSCNANIAHLIMPSPTPLACGAARQWAEARKGFDMHTKDEEILALKAALKYTEFASQGDCCPWCGGHGYHGQGCGIDALLREEAAESFKAGTGGTVINDWIWTVNTNAKYASLKPVVPAQVAQGTILLAYEEFVKLPTYSVTNPTGQTIGKKMEAGD